MTRLPAIAALLAGASVVIGGCGGGSSSTSSARAPDATFKRAFLLQVGQLRTVGTQLSVALQGASSQSDAKVQASFAALARSTGPLVAGLATLKPPARYAADVATMHDSLARAQEDLRAVSRAAAGHRAVAMKLAFSRLRADSAAVKAADNRVSAGVGISH